MKVPNSDYLNFRNYEDHSFHTFYVMLDKYFKPLLSDKIGSTSAHPEQFSQDKEYFNSIWEWSLWSVY